MKPNGIVWVATENGLSDNLDGFAYSFRNRDKNSKETNSDSHASKYMDVSNFDIFWKHAIIYVGPNTTVTAKTKSTVEDILRSNTLGQKEFNTLFKTDLITSLLKSYKETKSSLDALRLLVAEKIMQLYISYGNTPTGTSPSAADLALRDEIAKMDRIEPDKDYSFVKELKNVVKDIEIEKLDLGTDEAKEFKKQYETEIDLKKIETE